MEKYIDFGIMQSAQFTREFFITRAVELLDDYSKVVNLRGEDDGLAKVILETSKLNKRLAEIAN